MKITFVNSVHYWMFMIIFMFTVISCTSQESNELTSPNTLTEEEINDGWELIFDGETLQGWRGLNMEHVPEGHWVAENGTLKKVARDSIPPAPDGERPQGGDLLLDRPLNNFELAFEWKVSPVANSGIKYNVSEELSASDGNPHSALGFEYQVLDDPEYPQLEDNPSWATAGLYELVEPGANARLNPAGEWNSGRILFNNNYGEHWLNGERVLTFELGSPEMNTALAASKWNDIEEFGHRHEDAFIILQDHGDTVWYRNLKLRELP
jgi:hypothetical protein